MKDTPRFTLPFATLAVWALLGATADATEITFTGAGTNPRSGQGIAASATFRHDGGNLFITLSNVGDDAVHGSDLLTALFFDLVADPELSALEATVAQGSEVWWGTTDPGQGVGGEWAYRTGLAGTPMGQSQGISSASFRLFGKANFSGSNLQGNERVGGLQYGLSSANDDPATGTRPVTGKRALVHSAVVFQMGDLPEGFKLEHIGNVGFQYGKSFEKGDPYLVGTLLDSLDDSPEDEGGGGPPLGEAPEPSTLLFMSSGAIVLLLLRRLRA